jgi:hypothetical protein
MNAKITALQEQVDTLFANINSLQNHDASISAVGSDQSHSCRPLRSMSQASISAGSPSQNRGGVLAFEGLMSTAYNFGAPSNLLQTVDIHTGPEGAVDEGVATGLTPVSSLNPVHPKKDPLWSLSKEEVIRLARVYEEEVIAYPPIDSPFF